MAANRPGKSPPYQLLTKMEQKKMVEIWFIANPKRSVLIIAKQTAMKATRYGKNRWRDGVFWSDTGMVKSDSYVIDFEPENEKLSRGGKFSLRATHT